MAKLSMTPTPLFCRSALSALAGLLIGAGSATAAAPPSWSSSLATGYFAATDADLDRSGSLASQFFYLDGAVKRSFANEASIGIGLSSAIIDYDFADLGNAPFERADFLTLSLPISIKYGADGRISFIGSLGAASEEQASWDEGVTSTAIVSYLHTYSRRLSVGLGAGYVYGLEDATFFPMLIIRWQISDSLLLANPFRPGPFGPAGLELSYRFSDQFDIGVGGVYRSVRFALADDALSAPGGFAEISGVPVFVRAGWAATPNITVDGYVGLTVGGELTIDNNNGDELTATDYDSQPLVGLTISGRF